MPVEEPNTPDLAKLTDARALRALSHPVRLVLLEVLGAPAGLRYVVRSPVLRGFTLACAASTAVLGFTESAILAVAEVGFGRPTNSSAY